MKIEFKISQNTQNDRQRKYRPHIVRMVFVDLFEWKFQKTKWEFAFILLCAFWWGPLLRINFFYGHRMRVFHIIFRHKQCYATCLGIFFYCDSQIWENNSVIHFRCQKNVRLPAYRLIQSMNSNRSL